MEIIKCGKIPAQYKIATCGNCKSVIKVYIGDVKATPPLAILHDGMGQYNFNCPVCKCNIDFDTFDGEE